ncbi:hypothetical protein FKW77_002321 [Venturia effusa]|uniref:RlpA-like protein double-psi beta-barrel domain-containing protein n=1 Tax=Venturia effusa TaxID=50376 RepID=A0A517LKY8_9PEZI|nr:hypothetical protein FKW77_002321 [Venturia effusa]
MKYSLAASFAMAALVGAAPLNNKRAMVYSTATVEEWVTEWSTTTVWEGEATPGASSPTPVGGFYEVKSSAIPTPSEQPAVKPTSVSSASSSYSTPAAPVVVSSTSSSISIAPPPTSTPAYIAPTTLSSTYVAPSPTSTYVAPVVETPKTTAAPVATTSSADAYVAPAVPTSKAVTPVVAATSSTSGGSGTSSGDMTYYDVSVGLTSCGLTGSNSDFLVAMNKPDMANGVNPNNNPNCNKYINIYYNGVGPIKGKVVDTCPECASGSIDVTDSLFKAIAPNGDGRVKGVSWSWA